MEEMGVDALCEANKEQPLQGSGAFERYQHMSLSLHHFRLKQPYALQLMKSAQLHWPGLQRRMPAVLMSEEQKPTQAYKVTNHVGLNTAVASLPLHHSSQTLKPVCQS
eukprot:2900825-Pleurochrysis_carterae.AAC.3